jgi:hypothetical protein
MKIASEYFAQIGGRPLLDGSIVGKQVSKVYQSPCDARVVEAGFRKHDLPEALPIFPLEYIKLNDGREFAGPDLSRVWIEDI